MRNLKYRFYQQKLSNLLFEQEEPDEAATEEEGGEAAEEEGDEAAEDEPEESSDEKPEVSLDSDIEAVLIDFESSARKSVSVDESIKMLYEQSEEIDMDAFAADVARLVKNYDNLLDIEKMLVDKASDFIKSRYDDEASRSFLDKLETQHDIEVEKPAGEMLSSDLETPLAVGAGTSGE